MQNFACNFHYCLSEFTQEEILGVQRSEEKSDGEDILRYNALYFLNKKGISEKRQFLIISDDCLLCNMKYAKKVSYDVSNEHLLGFL